MGAVETRVQWEAWFEALRGLAPLDSKSEASAAVDVAARVRDRVIVIVPGGGIRPECGLVGRCGDHPVALDLGFEQDAINARRAVVMHGEGGVDGTEEVHVEVVITHARRHKIGKVSVGRFCALTAEAPVDHLGIERLRVGISKAASSP